jgi:hypothetical protein
MSLVKGKDALGPEGTSINGGVKDVNYRLCDGTLGGVINSKWNWEGERDECHLA